MLTKDQPSRGVSVFTNGLKGDKMNKRLFFETVCPTCGTQRCDGSDFWMEGCHEWKKNLKNDEGERFKWILRRLVTSMCRLEIG